MKIGDIVTEIATWELRNPTGALGVVMPLPLRLVGTQLEQELNNGNIVWVYWTGSDEDNWSFTDELEVKSENR
jgi:hypothetical protein